jgi:outer membrane murein-binding lipoprotein Lpp
MSALRAPASPGTRPAAAPRRAPLTSLPGGAADRGRRLDAVRAPLQATSGVPFLVLCALILAGALLAALLLNTSMARGSYDAARLQAEVGRVAQDVQGKQEQLRAAEASLAERAAQLGMVPAEELTMISVEERATVGIDEGDAKAGSAGTP